LLLQLWTADTYRPTRDLDLLGRGVSNASYRKIFSEVCSQKVADAGLTFLPDTLRVERIRDDEAYGGLRVRVEARWAKCVLLFRLTRVSPTRSFRDLRNWNIPRSLNFLHRDCAPILRRVWLQKVRTNSQAGHGEHPNEGLLRSLGTGTAGEERRMRFSRFEPKGWFAFFTQCGWYSKEIRYLAMESSRPR
jgi:hypothetical protein